MLKLTKLLYRVDETEALLSFGRTKIMDLLASGELTAHCENGARSKPTRITAASIENYLNKHQVQSQDWAA